MTALIITLVNNALERCVEIPIQPSEFDSGYEGHHMIARQAVSKILKNIYEVRKDEKLKQEFTLSTVASQALYNLGFSSFDLASTDFRVIKSDNTDYWLTYKPESEALSEYIDFNNLTDEGLPQEWWFVTGATAGTLQIRLNKIPDDIYEIKGFKYVPYSAVTSISMTPFTEIGDEVVITYVAAQLAIYLQLAHTNELIRQASEAWSKYLLENFNTNNLVVLSLPHQVLNETE